MCHFPINAGHESAPGKVDPVLHFCMGSFLAEISRNGDGEVFKDVHCEGENGGESLKSKGIYSWGVFKLVNEV